MYTTCPTYERLPGCWLIFEQHLYRVDAMPSDVFRRFLESRATNDRRAKVLLDESITTYDRQARYYLLSEIMSWNRNIRLSQQCILYESREEAEQALQQKVA